MGALGDAFLFVDGLHAGVPAQAVLGLLRESSTLPLLAFLAAPCPLVTSLIVLCSAGLALGARVSIGCPPGPLRVLDCFRHF